jgi:hypothetical protein
MPVVLEETVAELPAPVGRSLRRSGVVGREIPSTVTVRQKGQLRQGPDSRWLSFTAHEEYKLDSPGFVWSAALKMGGLTVGRATDSLAEGHGRMHVRLLGLFNVVDATGPEMDQGVVMRWLNETMWFPAVWATDVISWEPIDETSAIGSVRVGGLTARAEFRFDHDGHLVDFRADRYRSVESGFEMTLWSTPLTEHARFDGIELPSRGSAVWILEDGDLEYIRIQATDIRYSN